MGRQRRHAMQVGRPLFSQVMDFVPWTSFDRLVEKYGGDKNATRLRCAAQFRAMAFAQMTFRESLRDIETSLNAHPPKLYGMGFRHPVAKSTLADANEMRDWRMWHDLAVILIRRARKLYAHDDIGLDLDNTVYALDSTTIDLCLSLFPWADFRSTKAAVKMRTKVNMKYHRVYSHPVPGPATGVGSDQSIALDGFYTKQDYPQHLRRVSFRDPETGLHLVFLTNNFTLSATMIAALYKKRWAVELFFKWIKHNLRIKHFYGTSENAVKTQIWIAVCVYVLAAIIKIDLALDVSLYTFLQVLSVHSFEKTPLAQALFDGTSCPSPSTSSNQLNLFTN